MTVPQPAYQVALDPAELAALERHWDKLAQQHHRLEVDHPFLTGENQKLVNERRRAEICYVMHRGDLRDGLLLHIKTFYPEGAFRLPTGGIHRGETVEGTLAREIYEETGLSVGTAPDQVHIQRCLGVVGYTLAHRRAARDYVFATYHFLVQMPADARLRPVDPGEQIGGWRWCAPEALIEVAERLERVGETHPEWRDWGRYRALSHRFVAAALAGD
jgi:8-oxo-dGTP pyrophosphatase MutT (NUDIX family)